MAKQYADIHDMLFAAKLDGLYGTGVSEEEIRFCETELDVRFPDSFRAFLVEYGWGYFGNLELIAGLGSDIPAEWQNGANLLHVVTDERNGHLRFPNYVIPFSQNGAGDWYALDCYQKDSEEVPVIFLSHEQSASGVIAREKCADSFADWVFANLSK